MEIVSETHRLCNTNTINLSKATGRVEHLIFNGGKSMYEKYEDLIKQINANGEYLEFYGKQNIESVLQLEKALKVKFPKSFTNFLIEFGGGRDAGTRFARAQQGPA